MKSPPGFRTNLKRRPQNYLPQQRGPNLIASACERIYAMSTIDNNRAISWSLVEANGCV